jgi:uncharacterized damage-inducible protein DinB
MGEVARLWDLLQRAYEGNAWHGPALRELVESVTSAQARTRPIPGAPTIWEITLHLAAYEDAVRRRIEGAHVESLPPEDGWPEPADLSPSSWRSAVEGFEAAHRGLRAALWDFPDGRLDEVVPGRDYPFYLMLNGVIHHELYHAGQIEMLARAQGAETPVAAPEGVLAGSR